MIKNWVDIDQKLWKNVAKGVKIDQKSLKIIEKWVKIWATDQNLQSW